jgi:hypothetical protein
MTLAAAAVDSIPAGLVVPRFLYCFVAIYLVLSQIFTVAEKGLGR